MRIPYKCNRNVSDMVLATRDTGVDSKLIGIKRGNLSTGRIDVCQVVTNGIGKDEAGSLGRAQ